MLCAISDIARHRWQGSTPWSHPGHLCALLPPDLSLPNRSHLLLQFFGDQEHPELEGEREGAEESSKAGSLTSIAMWLCWLLLMLPNRVARSLLVCGNNNEQVTRGGSRRLCFLVWESVVGASLRGF